MFLIISIITIVLTGAVVISLPNMIACIKKIYAFHRLFGEVKMGNSGINPMNEGKLVMISGELEMLCPAVDKEQNKVFGVPVVRRIDEIYSRKESRKRGRYSYGWGISADRYIIGGAKIRDFEIDQEILSHIPCEKYMEMATGKRRYMIERINYQTYKTERMTIFGIQHGNKLMDDKRFEGQDIFFGIHNADEILKISCTEYRREIGLTLVLLLELIVLFRGLCIIVI